MVSRAIVEAVQWCRDHNARIRFESSGKVAVMVNGFTRRRDTLREAVGALQLFLVSSTRNRCGVEGCRLPPEHDGQHKYGGNIP